MSDALLVLNAGSSSLKFSVFLDEDPPRPLLRGQLEGLYEEARTAVRSRDDIVAFISHDLRNPLESISAATTAG